MADAQLQITIKARNQAKAEFDKLDKQVKNLQGQSGVKGLNKTLGDLDSKFKSVTGVSLGFATAAGAASAAVSGLIKFMTDAVNETVAYATEVDNLSRLLGISTEDTSRLIQASDDLFISQDKLKSGLQAATRQGIDVSINGLKELSEQYLALPEGVERSEFVLKNFGRSGAEMGKLMEIGAAGIDEATTAIAKNMIISNQSMNEIMNFKRSVDNLQDSWQGFKYTIGQEVIPQLDHLMRQLSKGKDEVEVFQDRMYALNEQMMFLQKYGRQGGLTLDEFNKQAADIQAQIDALNAEWSDYNKQAEAAALEQQTLNDKLNELKTIMGGQFGKEIESFNQKVRDLKIEQAGVVDRIKELEGLNYLTPEQKAELDDLRKKHGDISLAIQDMQAQHETAMKTMAMNMIIAKASSDGLTETEITNINDIMVAWGLWDEETARVIGNINAIDLNDANLEINGLKENILGIPDRTVTIRVRGEIDNSAREAASFGATGRNSHTGLAASPRAVGGPVTGGTPYIVGEVGPELFVPNTSGSIVPHNQLAGSTVVNFYYSPAISLTDRTEAETRLVPIIRKALARA